MSENKKTILADVGGFTPVIDSIVASCGVIPALVFGSIWRRCQMSDGVCSASLDTIAHAIGMSGRTVSRHAATLVKLGYLACAGYSDAGVKIYRDTGKAGLYVGVVGGDTPPGLSVTPPGLSVIPPMTKSHTPHDRESYER